MLVASIGCEEQVITQLEVGRDKLLGAGLAIEAVGHLKRAEFEEAKTGTEKIEPRALLLIAYSHALKMGDANTQGIAAEYERERNKRLAALNDVEMRKILNILDERHRTQQATIEILIDKGSASVPLLIEGIGRNRYAKIRADLVEMLHQIGSKGLEPMIAALRDANVPHGVKSTLIRLIGRINNPSAIPSLESLQSSSDAELGMEINIALYQLGKTGYRSKIIAGLSNSGAAVRRAAAKAMQEINEPPTDVILKGLKDSDAQVRMYSAQTLTKLPTQNAINPLIEILKSDENESAKQAAKEALMVHSQNPFGRNLARLLIKALPHVSEPNDRVRVVQILKSEVPLKQIKTAPKEHDDNIEYDLYQYYTEKEQNAMVKDELSGLLFLLGN